MRIVLSQPLRDPKMMAEHFVILVVGVRRMMALAV